MLCDESEYRTLFRCAKKGLRRRQFDLNRVVPELSADVGIFVDILVEALLASRHMTTSFGAHARTLAVKEVDLLSGRHAQRSSPGKWAVQAMGVAELD